MESCTQAKIKTKYTTAVQPAIHPTISRTGKSLWDKAVGRTSRETNTETITHYWEAVEIFIDINSGSFFAYILWVDCGFLTSLGHGTSLCYNLLVVMDATPSSML